MSTVYLDPPIWQMYEAKLLTVAQASRLQELSTLADEGQPLPPLSKRDQDLLMRYRLFHAPTGPMPH